MCALGWMFDDVVHEQCQHAYIRHANIRLIIRACKLIQQLGGGRGQALGGLADHPLAMPPNGAHAAYACTPITSVYMSVVVEVALVS